MSLETTMPRHKRESDYTVLEEDFSARDFMEEIITSDCQTDKDAFLVTDLGDVVKKHLRFLKTLPRVKPFYAVKCNNCRPVVKLLAELGAGFDCASKGEIKLVQEFGVKSEDIIYANPCKQMSHIQFAATCGVQMMTFDNEEELSKISQNHPNAKVILRLFVDDTKATVRLNVKFGAPLSICRHLLETAKKLKIDVIGVSFHVGSGCNYPDTYVQGIADARLVFQMASELGQKMTLLDIGGGFPGTEDVKIRFEEFANVINEALDLYFPEASAVDIIAEPGRYYVESSLSLAANIIGKRDLQLDPSGLGGEENSRKKNMFYYLNDGIYGSFSCTFLEKTLMKPIIYKKPTPEQPIYCSSLWGPTCDGTDRIAENLYLPELHIGDWLLFKNLGAYSLVLATSAFNGFCPPKIYFVMSHQTWEYMQCLKKGVQQAGAE